MYDEKGEFYLDAKDKAILQKCVYENPYIPFNPFPKQAEMISDYIHNHQNMSIVLCGDINDTPISYTHHILTKHLTDCYTKTGIGLGFSHKSKGIYVRIDNILCSDDMEPFECKINTNVELSDHYPIICSIKKRQKPKK